YFKVLDFQGHSARGVSIGTRTQPARKEIFLKGAGCAQTLLALGVALGENSEIDCYKSTSEARRQQKASSWVWIRDSKLDISMHLLNDQERLTVLQPQHPRWSRRGKRRSTLNARRSMGSQRSRLTILDVRRMSCPLLRVLKRKLAILRYGEEQVGWENSKSERANGKCQQGYRLEKLQVRRDAPALQAHTAPVVAAKK
ncbi:MAG: hypothetical protein Q9214_003707, partial [Letrouitia sp. 1 TL-2023]